MASASLLDRVLSAAEQRDESVALEQPVAIDGIELEVTAQFPAEKPAGYLALALEHTDRELRYAARAAETGMPVHVLRRAGTRPIPVVEALALAGAEPGSVRLRFVALERLRRAAETNLGVVLLAAVGLTGYTVRDVWTDDPADSHSTKVVIETDGRVQVDAPEAVIIKIRRGREVVVVEVRQPQPAAQPRSPRP